ncbi:hypothetical protein AB0K34_13910 [Actinomadura sp. NPDC049382]|uniref:hypothetical protein n=1 Tax=Actinomadura sp. NPDC049382 TaxID=3158220 RepID=UPI003425A4BB
MADDGYPYPGVSQITTAAEWEAFFSAAQLDGVVSGLAPSIQSGARTASIAAGGAYLRGYYKPVTSTTASPVPAAAGQDRADRLVLRLDRAAASAATYILPTVVTGTAGSGSPPALTRGATGAWDLPICRWTSKADGSLTGLVDERYGPGWFTSAARAASLVSAAPARVAVEIDTGQIYRSDGSAWTSVYQDTGWINLELAWPTVWSKTDADTCAVRLHNGIVGLKVSATRKTFFGRTDPDGSQLVTLPIGMRPVEHPAYGIGQFSSGDSIRIDCLKDGRVIAIFPSRDIPAGATLRCGVTFPI